MLHLLALLPLLALAAAQSPGQWTMNASIPQTNPSASGCLILAQLTGGPPNTLQALFPICPSTSRFPTDPSTGHTIPWPLAGSTGDGDGVKSAMAIYGQIQLAVQENGSYRGQAGCVISLPTDSVQYLLGRSLTWNNNLQELWDNTGNGFVSDANGAVLTCGHDATLLPPSLQLPDPFMAAPDDPVWAKPISLTAPTGTSADVGAATTAAGTDASATNAATTTSAAGEQTGAVGSGTTAQSTGAMSSSSSSGDAVATSSSAPNTMSDSSDATAVSSEPAPSPSSSGASISPSDATTSLTAANLAGTGGTTQSPSPTVVAVQTSAVDDDCDDIPSDVGSGTAAAPTTSQSSIAIQSSSGAGSAAPTLVAIQTTAADDDCDDASTDVGAGATTLLSTQNLVASKATASAASPTVAAAQSSSADQDCEIQTVTEHYTTTVTAQPMRRGYPPRRV